MNTYKRFIVFGLNDYENQGGLNDCYGDFDTFDDAVLFVKDFDSKSKIKLDSFEIFDRIEGVIIPFER